MLEEDQETQGAQEGALPSSSGRDDRSKNYGVACVLLSVLEYLQRETVTLSSNHEVRTINVKKNELIYYRYMTDPAENRMKIKFCGLLAFSVSQIILRKKLELKLLGKNEAAGYRDI